MQAEIEPLAERVMPGAIRCRTGDPTGQALDLPSIEFDPLPIDAWVVRDHTVLTSSWKRA